MLDVSPHEAVGFPNWPDPLLYRCYSRLLGFYEELFQRNCKNGNDIPTDLNHSSFSQLCALIVTTMSDDPVRARTEEQKTLAEILGSIRSAHRSHWLQSMASVLGMLLHLSPGANGTLVNPRRPK